MALKPLGAKRQACPINSQLKTHFIRRGTRAAVAQRRHWVSVQAALAPRVGGLASTSLLSPVWSTCPQRTYLGRISWGAKCCTAHRARQPKSRCGTELQRRCSFIKADRTEHKRRVPPPPSASQRTISVLTKGVLEAVTVRSAMKLARSFVFLPHCQSFAFLLHLSWSRPFLSPPSQQERKYNMLAGNKSW